MKVMKTTIEHLYTNKKVVLDKVVIYRLFHIRSRGRRHYAINVSSENDSSTCRFGSNRAKASEIYRLIVKNEVTPCSLADIAEDFGKTV